MKQEFIFGLIGGMTFESSEASTRMIYDFFREKTNFQICPKMHIYNLDMNEVARYQAAGNKKSLGYIMEEAGIKMAAVGCDFCILCSNTMHEFAQDIELNIPLLDIRKITAQKVLDQGIKKAALLGTKYTMEGNFYRQVFEEQGIEILIPNEVERDLIHHVIYEELWNGQIVPDSAFAIQKIIGRLRDEGAQGVILGCTELPLLIEISCLPVFNTTKIQAEAAVKSALLIS